MTHILFATEDTENTKKIRSVTSAQAGIKLCVLCGYNLLFEYEYYR